MPQIKLIFYQDNKGRVPILEWFKQLPNKVQTKCFVKLERLSQLGQLNIKSIMKKILPYIPTLRS